MAFGYDDDGLVTSAAPFDIARRADNALPTTVSAPGFALTRDFNAYGEIDAADYGAYSYEVTRDVSGRIVTKAEETSAGVTTSAYTYDALGRLAEVTRDGELSESYAWDENGNRTETFVPLRGIDTTQSAHFDTEDRATHVGDATYTYAPDGYLALKHSQEGTTTYAYTAFGELSQATLPDGRSVTYTYDASGRRTSKAIDGAVTERYLWADTTRLLATYDAEGALLMRFLYADARTPFGADTPAGRIFFAYDQTGSLRTVTAEDGSLLKSVAHDSFGNLIADSAPDLAVPLGFAGGLYDADTGLTLFGARDYDAELGRWIAKDPIGFAGGDANLYGYCLGDPVNLVDPSGLIPPITIIVVVVLGAIAAVGTYAIFQKEIRGATDEWSNAGAVVDEEDVIASCERAHDRLESGQAKAPAAIAMWDATLSVTELSAQAARGFGSTGNIAHWPGLDDALSVGRSVEYGSLPADALVGGAARTGAAATQGAVSE